MKKIVYIGTKPQKGDNVAGTGLVWKPGEVHAVEDDKKAAKLLEHPTIWADADQPYEMQKPPAPTAERGEPQVNVVPQGGEDVGAFWDPMVIPVTADVWRRLQRQELETVFMTPDDAQAFSAFKQRSANSVKKGAKATPEKAAETPA